MWVLDNVLDAAILGMQRQGYRNAEAQAGPLFSHLNKLPGMKPAVFLSERSSSHAQVTPNLVIMTNSCDNNPPVKMGPSLCTSWWVSAAVE